MKIPVKYLIVAISVLVLALFFGGWYMGAQRVKKSSELAKNTLKGEIQKLTVEINDKEYSLTKVEQQLATERELRKQDVIEKEELKVLNIKRLKELTRLKLRIDTLLPDVSNNGHIVTVHDTITINKQQNAMLLPFSFWRQDEWLNLRGDFNSKGALDISLKMDVPVDIYSGIDKTTKKNTLYLTTPNKYVEAISVRSFKTDVIAPKRYGLGFFIGYGISKNGQLSPLIGVGIGYTPIRF